MKKKTDSHIESNFCLKFSRKFSFFSLLFLSNVITADTTSLPLITFSEIEDGYKGAFIVRHKDTVSSTDYAEGKIAYNNINNSVFMDSHTYQDALGEFAIPRNLSKSLNVSDLPVAAVIQGFSTILDRSVTGNNNKLDNLGSLAVIDNKLWAQVYEFYDAPADNTYTTLIIQNPEDLSGSAVFGFYELKGAAKTISYISEIPKIWQPILGGNYLAGNGGGIPINTRLSLGPSLYSFNASSIIDEKGSISSREWLSYPLSNALSTSLYQFYDSSGKWDSYNNTGLASNFSESNTLWTEASFAAFAFIVPGTSTFAVIGESGMHNSGGGYKITQSNGNLCPGGCSYDPNDQYPYYWLYDMNSIVKANNTFDPIPYEYGRFDNKFPYGFPSSGSFDIETMQLFIVNKAASEKGGGGSPIITVYDLSQLELDRPSPPGNIEIR